MLKFLQNVGSCGVGLEVKVLPDTEVEGAIDGDHVAVFLREVESHTREQVIINMFIIQRFH